MDDLSVIAAGREVPDALDRIRRYCGLQWSGGPPETWAWHYYDVVTTDHDSVVTPTDVLCAAALHPALSRADLGFFREEERALSVFLQHVPADVRLGQATESDIARLASLPEAFPGVSVTLLSKVLHRKRPHLIPLLDRHVIDWYRPITRKRTAAEAWEPLLRAMNEDQLDDERSVTMSVLIAGIEAELRPDPSTHGGFRLSWIRAVDIAIWMGSR